MSQKFLDLAGLTAYDAKIKAWIKSGIVDITDDEIGALFAIVPGHIISGPWVAFIAQEDNSSIGLETLSTNQTLEYSTDTSVWSTFDTTTNISLNNNDKVYVRGILSGDNSNTNYTQFKMTGKIAASGNCNAIWNYQDLNTPLKNYSGRYMFNNCTSLTTAPELPATTLAQSCYSNMFKGCISLETAPELPATTLVSGCYYYMFGDCTKLNYIKCLARYMSVNGCTDFWVNNVSSTGTFVKHPDMNGFTTGRSGIPTDWTVEDAVL